MAALMFPLPGPLCLLPPHVTDLVQGEGNHEDENPEFYPHSHVRSLIDTQKKSARRPIFPQGQAGCPGSTD
ncbi:MAG: hypothetical protein NBV65_00250 [Burkholderiaceae bacterium]|nr:hypothetical protein [Burkholderiaceae bacterium]